MTLAGCLACGQDIGLERLDSQLLLLHVLGRVQDDRAWLLAHATDPASEAVIEAYMDRLRRRATGEPLAYIVGRKEFFGLDLQVDARVLVPRPDTETLVTWALELLNPARSSYQDTDDEPASGSLPRASSPMAALDLGTGSGAIALALKHHCPAAAISAIDVSSDALTVARQNAIRLGLDVKWIESSWFERVPGRYHLIVSNPPYVAIGDEHLKTLTHEPQQALVSGDDGLDDLRRIAAQAHQYLCDDGWLLLEHGHNQARAVRELLQQRGFSRVQSRVDIAGIERCTGGQWAAAR